MAAVAYDESACYKHVQTHLNTIVARSPVYSHLFSHIRLVHASPGRVVAVLKVEKHLLNSKDSLHGSVSAALVDFIGGVAIASYDNRDNTGVSTDMNIRFLSGATLDEMLEVEGTVDKCGGTLAYTTATIRKQQDRGELGTGPVVSIGSHTKYVKQKP